MSAQTSKRPPARRRDVLDLVNVLARAGWGPGLSRPAFRAPRIILTALANKAYDAHLGRAGAVITTANQLADFTGYSQRWTREALHRLEDMGIIIWHRGGIIDGRPMPSHIRILKSALCSLIEIARNWHKQRLSARAEATALRLKNTLRNTTCRGRRRIPKTHAEVGTPLSLLGKGTHSVSHSTPNLPENLELKYMLKDDPAREFLPSQCKHHGRAGGDPNTCMQCINGARADWEHFQIRRYGTAKPALQPVPATDNADDETAFTRYMRETYPDASPRQWARLAQKDDHAKELSRATA